MKRANPPLLDALLSLKPNVIYTMAPPNELASAAASFCGAVKAFRWGESGRVLEAVMEGENRPAVRFTSKDGKLQSAFDSGSGTTNLHVLAAIMTISCVLHGAKFHRDGIKPTRLKRFRDQLKAPDVEAPRARVIFSRSAQSGRFEIDFDSGRREASWRVGEHPSGMEWLRWQDREPGRVAEAFCRWLERKPKDVDIEVRRPDQSNPSNPSNGSDPYDDRHNIPQPSARAMPCRIELLLTDEGVEIRRAILDEQGRAVGPFLDLGYGLVLLTEQAVFIHVQPPETWEEFGRLRELHQADHAFAVSADDFNAGEMLQPGGTFTLLDRTGNPAKPLKAALKGLVSAQTDGGIVRVSFRAQDGAAGMIPLHGALAGVLEKMFSDGFFALLVKSPARRRAMTAILAKAISAPEDAERLLSEASRDSAFGSFQMHGEDAMKCLSRLLNRLTRLDEPRLAVDPGRSGNPWMVCTGAGRALGRAFAAFVEAFPDEDPLRSKNLTLEINDRVFFSALPRLMAACAGHDVELRVDEGIARVGTLDLSVRARRDGALDWFELHPEVCAGALNLPRSQWDEILRTGRYRAEDKTLVALDDNSLSLLRRMTSLLEPGSDENLRLPRLRLFDWLALRSEGIACDLPSEDEAVLQSLQQLETIPSCTVPSGLRADLREYQQHGYDWLCFLYRHRFGACLADDMGLGKTLQAIALLAALKEGILPRQSDAPHLLVLPPTLLFNWQAEIERFAPALKIHEYTGLARSADFSGADIVMTTYELVRRDIDVLSGRGFDVAIFDEAQAVKNSSAARTVALTRLQARFRLCLTGTPLENHVGEFHSIMETAVPGLFGDRRQFIRQQEAGLPVVHRARPFLLRRTKEKILAELPPKVESDAYFSLSDSQKECYTRAVGEVRQEVLAAYGDRPASQAGIMALAALMRLRQICISPAMLSDALDADSPKIEHLVEQLQELAEEGHAALVFSQFVKALDLVARALDAAGLPHLRMDGKTPMAQRRKIVSAFQSGDSPGIFLVSMKTGGSGLNLTRASYVYHLDPWWNPAVERQASDRAHRLGQKSSVFVQRLLMRHTVEEKMMALKQCKQELFAAIVEGGEAAAPTGAAGLSADDFRFLVED